MNDVLSAMKAAGLSDAAINAIQSRMTRRVKIPLGALACPGCGAKAARFDYACGSCGQAKAERERRFWQYVIEREEGTGSGRPKQEKPRVQQLPAQMRNEPSVILVPVPDELPPLERKPERIEWLVTVGMIGRVVVAEMPFEAIRLAHRLNGDPETTGHSILRLGVALLDDSEYEAPDVPAPAI